jgi:predicted small lipoprotein YifL
LSVRTLFLAPRGRVALALLGLAALALAGCGRMGPLEPPGGVPKQAEASGNPADQAVGLNARKAVPPIVAPIRDLPMDFLVK